MKPVHIRSKADEDLNRALDEYANEDPDVADAFLGAVELTYRRAARLPASGSPRFAHDLGIEGLRALAVPRFPYLVFYLETPRTIAILRVLHQRRDIPPLLDEE